MVTCTCSLGTSPLAVPTGARAGALQSKAGVAPEGDRTSVCGHVGGLPAVQRFTGVFTREGCGFQQQEQQQLYFTLLIVIKKYMCNYKKY